MPTFRKSRRWGSLNCDSTSKKNQSWASPPYGTLYGIPGISKSKTTGKCLKRMVSAEGIESAQKRKFNNMQGHGWHESTWKAVEVRLTDRKRIAREDAQQRVLDLHFVLLTQCYQLSILTRRSHRATNTIFWVKATPPEGICRSCWAGQIPWHCSSE